MFNQPLTHFKEETAYRHLGCFDVRSGKPCSARLNAGSDLSRKFHDYSLLDYIRRLRKDGVIVDLDCSHSEDKVGHF